MRLQTKGNIRFQFKNNRIQGGMIRDIRKQSKNVENLAKQFNSLLGNSRKKNVKFTLKL